MSYTHITRQERETLACLLMHNNSIRDISQALNKHRSTIYREIERNIKPGANTTTRVNKPAELLFDGRNYRGQAIVDTIQDKKQRYFARLRQFEASRPRYEAAYAEDCYNLRQQVAKDSRRKLYIKLNTLSLSRSH